MITKQTLSQSTIIPAILTTSPQDFANKLEFARSVGAVHVDVIDGTFCAGEALEIDKWPLLETNYAEAHLMVKEPINYLEAIAAKGVTRAIVHVESRFDELELERVARSLDLLLGYAVNPDTDLLTVKRYLETNAYIQIMGVDPGYSGQAIYPQTSLALQYLRKTSPYRLTLTVDGGVNAETAGSLRAAGANYLIENHAVFYRRPYQDNYNAMLSAAESAAPSP